MKARKPPSERRERLPDPPEVIRKITRLLVAYGRHAGKSDAETRSMVLSAIKEALAGDARWEKYEGDERFLSNAGLFRMIIEIHDLDRSDQRLQETWYAAAERALESALGEAPRTS